MEEKRLGESENRDGEGDVVVHVGAVNGNPRFLTPFQKSPLMSSLHV